MNIFENIDYFAEAFGIQTIGGESTLPDQGDSKQDLEEDSTDLLSMPGGMIVPTPDPAGEDTTVRDWLLRRHMTLHTKEVNEKLRNNEKIVVEDPFAEPKKDVSDPFYPGGLEGNPNTAPPENPNIVYDPGAEEYEVEELQNPDLGDPTGEYSSNYMCYVPNTDIPTGPNDEGLPFTQEECAEAGADWREIPMDVNPEPGGDSTLPDQGAEGKVDNKSGSVWEKKYNNSLPDKSFLYVPPGCGKRGKDGKTIPLRCRKYPIKNKVGTVDLTLLRKSIVKIGRSTGLSKQVRSDLLKKANFILEQEKGKRKK
jgi:hypothetical protein